MACVRDFRPASICRISAAASFSGSIQSHFVGSQSQARYGAPLGCHSPAGRGARQHGHVHPARPDRAAQLVDHHRMLPGRDAAAELDQGDPRVREVPLGGVAGEIAIGHAQRRADLQQRAVLERLVGAAGVRRGRAWSHPRRDRAAPPGRVRPPDRPRPGRAAVSGAGEVMNIANIAAIFFRSSSASS